MDTRLLTGIFKEGHAEEGGCLFPVGRFCFRKLPSATDRCKTQTSSLHILKNGPLSPFNNHRDRYNFVE